LWKSLRRWQGCCSSHGEMKKDTNIKQTYTLCRRFLRKQGAILWSTVAGRRTISILTASLAAFAGCLVLLAAIADWQIRRLDVNLIPEMEESSHVYDRNGKELCQFWKQERTVVPLSNISTNLVNAILAMEDHDFYQHHGYDLGGIVRAGWAPACRKNRARRKHADTAIGKEYLSESEPILLAKAAGTLVVQKNREKI